MQKCLKNFLLKNHYGKKMFNLIMSLKNNTQRMIWTLFGFLFSVNSISDTKVVFTNYRGKGYGDNPKYIAEEIIKQGLDLELVWLVDSKLIKSVNIPSEIRIVKDRSLKALYELATAKVWIDNCRKSFYPPKRKGQFYIQTWHGSVALKKIEKDAESSLTDAYIKNAKLDSQIADLFVSNGRSCTDMYRNAFWYEGEILEAGTPRCDILVQENPEIAKKVKNEFKIDGGAKIALYAPTFRLGSSTDPYDLDYELFLNQLEKTFGGKWVALVRLHPNIMFEDGFIEYSSKVINATRYDDMYELLSASDILVTDYSSTMFEFSFANKKPVFLYATDVAEYTEERDFYFDLRTLPYNLAENNKELISIIENFHEIEYKKNLSAFRDELGIIENGTASKQVVEAVKEIVNNQNVEQCHILQTPESYKTVN